MLSDSERKTLLRIARETLKAVLERQPRPTLAAESEALRQPCGCFVTMRNHGRLRGCIGTFTARAPLYQTVQQMAEAGTRDPRFVGHPVTAAELDQIDLEVSVLSPLEKVADPLKDIELGRHGIYINGPYGSGCFLPQVATETGWSLEEFLSNCAAHKAGLPPDAWKDPAVTVYRFEAEVFGEKSRNEG
jgi:AmmeMemoRadiSam system protein A